MQAPYRLCSANVEDHLALIKGIRPRLLNLHEAIVLHALAVLYRETPADEAIERHTGRRQFSRSVTAPVFIWEFMDYAL
jgi:hypothetical protein